MYHEVIGEMELADKLSYRMTPGYFMPIEKFETQVKLLADRDYKGIDFSSLPEKGDDGKYGIITFDDGWAGNFSRALPVLKKYGFKAVFFITVGFIGSEGYMGWGEVNKLLAEGMSIQSHGMTHRPLQTLGAKDILYELQESKRIIEKQTGQKVSAFSFPHGSFDDKILDSAARSGYRVVCSSELRPSYISSFNGRFSVIGRITMNSEIEHHTFIKLINFDRKVVFKEQFIKSSKNILKRTIGINNYRKLYRKYFNIETPDEIQ